MPIMEPKISLAFSQMSGTEPDHKPHIIMSYVSRIHYIILLRAENAQ
jgi:hypothetical protein